MNFLSLLGKDRQPIGDDDIRQKHHAQIEHAGMRIQQGLYTFQFIVLPSSCWEPPISLQVGFTGLCLLQVGWI